MVFKLLGLICFCLSTISFSVNTATIRFGTNLNPTSQDWIVTELSYPELTIVGSNDINVVKYGNGLGVVGGTFDTKIDSSEWLMFDFTANISNLYYEPWTYGSDTIQTVEAYNIYGDSLGTVVFFGIIEPHVFNVTDSFGGELLSGFKLQIDQGTFSLKSLTFEEVAPVPVPAAVWLFSSGLLGLIGVARHRSVEPAVESGHFNSLIILFSQTTLYQF